VAIIVVKTLFQSEHLYGLPVV